MRIRIYIDGKHFFECTLKDLIRTPGSEWKSEEQALEHWKETFSHDSSKVRFSHKYVSFKYSTHDSGEQQVLKEDVIPFINAIKKYISDQKVDKSITNLLS